MLQIACRRVRQIKVCHSVIVLHCIVLWPIMNESEYSNENLFVSRVLQCVPLFGTINFIWWNK